MCISRLPPPISPAALFCGMLCDIPMGLTEYSEGGWPNGSIVPALATLRPMSWLSYGDQKVVISVFFFFFVSSHAAGVRQRIRHPAGEAS